MKPQKRHHQDTRTALLDCAGELFLVHGFASVSIRQITEAAGTNVAAINYHFNGKTNLYREALALRLDEITRNTLNILKELNEQQADADLEQILHAYIRSFFDSLSSPNSDRLMQIIYREMGPDAIATDLIASQLIIPINQAVKQTILKRCPELGEEHVSNCVSSITGQVLHFIRARDILKTIRSQDQDQTFVEKTVHHITQFSLRGIGSKYHA